MNMPNNMLHSNSLATTTRPFNYLSNNMGPQLNSTSIDYLVETDDMFSFAFLTLLSCISMKCRVNISVLIRASLREIAPRLGTVGVC